MEEKQNSRRDAKNARGKKIPKPVTAERLEKAALAYLERYASSTENLRRVLMRRVSRSAMLHGTDPQEGIGWIDALIERYSQAGLLDDARFAEARAASLHRQGKSSRAIRQTLSVKGVGAEDIDSALDSLQEDVGADSDWRAAINYARRRRIGPWRRLDRERYRERDMAALGRQGFGYEIARRIVDAESLEVLEEDAE